jgi:hypothetical protein
MFMLGQLSQREILASKAINESYNRWEWPRLSFFFSTFYRFWRYIFRVA